MAGNRMSNQPEDIPRVAVTSTENDMTADADVSSSVANAIRNAIDAISKVEQLVAENTEGTESDWTPKLLAAKKILDGLDTGKSIQGRRNVSEFREAREPTKDAAAAFMERYSDDLEDWKSLVKHVEEACKLELQNQGVHARVSARVKDKNSLKEKLRKKQEKGLCQSLEAIDQEPWDIAGVRICLYFLSDASKVRDIISNHGDFKMVPQGTYTYLPTQEPPSEGTKYPFKELPERSHKPASQQSQPYEERIGYYDADHYWIELQGEELNEQHPEWKSKKVEIQVRSIFMNAWAEVRHDLDYKNILQGYPGDDELRTLDSIKGSISTCEVLLDNLRKLQDNRMEADQALFFPRSEGPDPDRFPRMMLQTLRSRHRQLLEVFPLHEERNSTAGMDVLRNLMEAFGIQTPAQMKPAIDDLTERKSIDEFLVKAQSLLSDHINAPLRAREAVLPKGLSLFEFLLIYLLLKPPEQKFWDTEEAYQVGMGWLGSLEKRLIRAYFLGRRYHEVPEHGGSLPIDKTPTDDIPDDQIQTLSTVWHLCAFHEADSDSSKYSRWRMSRLTRLSMHKLPPHQFGQGKWQKPEEHELNPLSSLLRFILTPLGACVPRILLTDDDPKRSLFDAMRKRVNKKFTDEYDQTLLTASLWSKPHWKSGFHSAYELLDSNATDINAAGLAGLARLLADPTCNSDSLSAYISWPEVDVNTINTVGHSVLGIPFIVRMFREEPDWACFVLSKLGPTKVNLYPEYLPSLLHYAILFGDDKVVKQLLDLGADVELESQIPELLRIQPCSNLKKATGGVIGLTPFEVSLFSYKACLLHVMEEFVQRSLTPRPLSKHITKASLNYTGWMFDYAEDGRLIELLDMVSYYDDDGNLGSYSQMFREWRESIKE